MSAVTVPDALGQLPGEAYAAALAAFPLMSLARLSALLRNHEPGRAHAVATGAARPSGLIAKVLGDACVRESWRRHAAAHPPAEMWERCAALGVDVTVQGSPFYPPILLDDRAAPPVLFSIGDRRLLAEGRRVAMVGTRNATAAGRDAARRIGRGLAEAGVHVVSGLARGIDGWSHRGLLEAQGAGRAIAVVASGVDVVYPKEHRELWRRVAETGVLLTESPPGTSPEAFRFPLRNRVIAALAEVVVVVESRERGGSLITVSEAAERNIPVMAVPGGLQSRASLGTNNLLREGSAVVVDASDVLVALHLDHRRSSAFGGEQRARPRGDDRVVYDTCAEEPRTIDAIALAAGTSLVDAAMSLARLEHAGWIVAADGWYETVGSPLR